VHVAVKLPIIRRALGSDIDATGDARQAAVAQGPVSRRMLLRGTWLAAAVAVVTASSAAGTFPGIGRVALLSPRSRRSGLPVNRTAAQAGVVAAATAADYRCRVEYAGRSLELSREELLALPQSTHVLPIGCVEGWSAEGRWTGVRLRTLLALLDIEPGHHVRIHSLQQHGADRITELPANFVDDERTLLALALDGETLAIDHGFPARIMAPDRPGALQTKWVARIEVL
jgi:DMSO/TMAO reductase YedYZ molybdopterin-dependent catalytic subunit